VSRFIAYHNIRTEKSGNASNFIRNPTWDLGGTPNILTETFPCFSSGPPTTASFRIFFSLLFTNRPDM
jgi:hypothetical protein